MRAKVSVPEIELGAFHLLARGDHLARVVVRHDARSSVATRLLARGWMDGWEHGNGFKIKKRSKFFNLIMEELINFITVHKKLLVQFFILFM